MSGTTIVSGTENNYFDAVTASDEIGGHIEYRCVYVFNDHDTEKVEDCSLWLSANNPNSGFSYVEWGIDPIAVHPVWPFYPSIYCDGVDEYVDCTNDATLWSTTLTKFSFTIWIFPTAAGDGTDRYVVNHGGASNHAFRLIIDASDPTKIRFQIKNLAGSNLFAESSGLKLNQWNFVACVYDNSLGSQNIKIYIDNVLGATTASLTESPNLSATLRLSENAGNTYKGYMKDFRFFKTKALSTSQIDDIYQGEDDSVTADYWLIMDENTGNAVDEKSGTKVGTLTNGAEWRTAQLTSSSTTSPVGMTWLSVTNGPVTDEPNLGDLSPSNRQCPFWVKWVVEDTEQDAADDHVIFTVQGKIPSGATPPPPEGGGTDPVPAPTAEDFTFAVCGDWGDESMTSTVVNLIKNNSPKPYVVCSVGDCAYDSGSGAVNDFLDRIDPIDDKNSIRFETAFGNHDNAESESDTNESTLKSHFGYNNTYFTFDHENVRFIFIDNTTETSFGSGSSQYNAVKGWLSSGRSDPDIDWIVVVAHKPMFGGDSKHDYNDGNFNQAYFPLFDQYKVDLMCFGHNHHMAQSKQVKYNSNNAESPTIVDSSTPYTGGAGRIHVICGTGGHDANDLYEVDSFSQTEWDNDTEHGALFVTVTNSGSSTTMTGRFKATDGDTLRTFVINR